MPIYQFKNLRTGQVEERCLPVHRRDCVEPHLKRITVPQRLTVFGTSSDKLEPGTADYSVPRAFRDLELSGKDRKTIERETGFSKDHIRRTWNF